MSTMVTVRVPDDTPPLMDQAAARRGMDRSAWLAAVIDRGLVGDGLLDQDVADARRAERAQVPRRAR